jgi:sialate O-acetylesterase
MKYTKYPEAGNKETDPDFHVSSAFGDHMVLQRERKVPVWGISKDIGKEVTVTFAGQTKKTTVTSDGKWSVTLDEMNANKNGQEMVITCNGKTQTLKDILIGDVFMVGGQSNAEKELSACGGIYSKDEIQALLDEVPDMIRYFDQGKSDATNRKGVMDEPQKNVLKGKKWKKETKSTANAFSAMGFFFAHKVAKEADVPVGMIMVASSGSPVSQLMSKEASQKANYTRYENNIPVSGMYNALMHPFINTSIKAML